jgi:hypothetical protein
MKYYYQVEGHLRNNIGDVLQGMVAKRFLPEKSTAVDREALSEISQTEPGLLIANGWYMHAFDKFPAPDNVLPIYTSVHIANSQLLLNPMVRSHFKKNGPIGCRDKKTLHLFLGWGIPAYYSSCLTTTCERKVSTSEKDSGELLLVDNVDHPVPDNVKSKIEKMLGKELVRVSHDPANINGTLEEYAKNGEIEMSHLLERYCRADLVVTTKIHCALPCLGMGARVLFIHPNPSDPRLAALSEFINIISYDDILKNDTIKVPEVRKDALVKRQKFFIAFVQKSISKGYNPIARPDTFQYFFIKLKSQVLALITRLGILAMAKLGIAKEKISRVYGI